LLPAALADSKLRDQENVMQSRPESEEYDLVVFGSGAAGKLLSWTLAKKGMNTGD
jgi:glycerol-3-phosphate dehydrogenase